MLSQERLKELLTYDPETGHFTWKIPRGTKKAGSRAGVKSKYILISVDGVMHGAHRLAFLYMEGYMPEEVDHADLHKHNNAWLNLRASTRSQNQANKLVSKRNLLGVKGVSRNGKGFVAQLTVGGVKHRSKTLPTVEAAAQAYAALAEKHHGEFAHY